MKNLEDEIEKHRRARSRHGETDHMDGEPDAVEARQRLHATQKRLGELQSARQGMLQLSREREIATKALSEMISAIRIGQPGAEGGSQEA